MNIAQLLAQTSQPVPGNVPFWANPQIVFFGLIIGVMFVMIFSSSRTRKVEAKTRNEMLANMKRGDRVQTIGGILGSVVEVREKDVVLKVDESTNTKIKFARDAIKQVLTGDEA